MPTIPKGRMRTGKDRLNGPATLSEGAAKVFKNTVEAVDPSHFSAVDLPLLTQFAQAADLAQIAQGHLDQEGAVVAGKANPWLVVLEKSHRSCVALAARLRVCPQSRFDRLVAGANSRQQPGTRKPWEFTGKPDPADEFFGD